MARDNYAEARPVLEACVVHAGSLAPGQEEKAASVHGVTFL
jgi:hypothetical protein